MISLEHLRQFKIGPFAIFDIAVSYLSILILSPILNLLMSKLQVKVPLISWLCFTLPLSVIFHLIFHQSTPLMTILADPSHLQFYIAIFILLIMTYVGFSKIDR